MEQKVPQEDLGKKTDDIFIKGGIFASIGLVLFVILVFVIGLFDRTVLHLAWLVSGLGVTMFWKGLEKADNKIPFTLILLFWVVATVFFASLAFGWLKI